MLHGMGVSIDMDPGEALRWEVNNTLGHIAWHRAVIEKWKLLKEDGTAIPMTPEQTEFYERYMAEREHLIKGARMAIAADVEGRAIRLAEKQAEMVANALDQVFAGLHLTEAQRAIIPELVPAIMREIEATASPIVIEGVFSTDDDLNQALAASRRATKEQK